MRGFSFVLCVLQAYFLLTVVLQTMSSALFQSWMAEITNIVL